MTLLTLTLTLSLYQCDDLTINWFKSYLQGREQCVIFIGNLSKTNAVTHGVFQCSILGPLLFMTFMNDLPLYIDAPLVMYADDSTIHVTGKTIEELESKLNIGLQNVQIWCPKNRMAINAEKTKLQTSEIKVNFNNTMLENVNSEKLLGSLLINI